MPRCLHAYLLSILVLRDMQWRRTRMCLAVPMRITSVDGYQCTCEAKGIEREVSLFMLQHEEIEPGDHVLVHVGYAIQKVSEQEAADSWELFDQVLAEV